MFSAVLNKLALSGNNIGDEGASTLGEALKSNKSLKDLELVNCGIGVEGGKALASALGIAVLTNLDVRYTRLTPEHKKVLKEAANTHEGFELQV